MKSEEMEKRRKLLGYSYAEVAVTEPYPLTRENVRKIVAEMLRVPDEPEVRQDRRKNGYIRETLVGIYNRDLKIHFQRIHELLKRAGYQSRADKG